jgi:citrate lyase subunit beta/citryl-CoA lyase
MHPSKVLFQDQLVPACLPVCDHYAGTEKLMLKSMTLQQTLGPVFDISFDCEDGASAGNELAHARLVADLLISEANHHNRIGVRVHDLDSPFFAQDLAEILPRAAGKLAYITIPKVKSAAALQVAVNHIQALAQRHGREQLPVHVLIETHDALAEVQQIAALLEVECLSFGIMDFVSAHYGAIPANAMHSPGQFTHPLVLRAKLEIAAACHRFGKVASHNVTTDFRDHQALANDAHLASTQCGYTRMWSIHPGQIEIIVRQLTPNNAQIHEACAILNKARQAAWGPIQMDGRLHDRASYRYYWMLLQRASLSNIPLPESAHCFMQAAD